MPNIRHQFSPSDGRTSDHCQHVARVGSFRALALEVQRLSGKLQDLGGAHHQGAISPAGGHAAAGARRALAALIMCTQECSKNELAADTKASDEAKEKSAEQNPELWKWSGKLDELTNRSCNFKLWFIFTEICLRTDWFMPKAPTRTS